MKLTTASGTQYIIKDIQKPENTEENILSAYTAKIARISGKTIAHIDPNRLFDNDQEFHEIYFFEFPTIGRSFQYVHELWNGCVSTAVEKIEKEDDGS